MPRPQIAQGTTCDGYLRSFAALFALGPSIEAHATAAGCSSTTILSGPRFLVSGGALPSGKRLESVEVFDPIHEGRTLTGPLVTARASHTATRLVNGSVLIAGGDDGVAVTAATEIYIPEISYTTSEHAIARGGADSNRGTYSYGGLLAAAFNSA